MNFLGKGKHSALLTAGACIVLGLVFLLLPDITLRAVCYLIAAGLCIIGVVQIFDFFRALRAEPAANGFAAGILAELGALFVLLKMDAVLSVFHILLGAVVIASAAGKAQSAALLYRRKRRFSVFVIAASVLCLAVGIVLVESPFQAAQSLSRATGAGLAFAGISDLGTMLLARGLYSEG